MALANPSWLGMLPAFTKPVFNIALHCIPLHFHQLHISTDNNQTTKYEVQELYGPSEREHLIYTLTYSMGVRDKRTNRQGNSMSRRKGSTIGCHHDYFWSIFQCKNLYFTAECMNKFILILIEICQCFDFMNRISLPFYAAHQIFLLGLHRYKIWLN